MNSNEKEDKVPKLPEPTSMGRPNPTITSPSSSTTGSDITSDQEVTLLEEDGSQADVMPTDSPAAELSSAAGGSKADLAAARRKERRKEQKRRNRTKKRKAEREAQKKQKSERASTQAGTEMISPGETPSHSEANLAAGSAGAPTSVGRPGHLQKSAAVSKRGPVARDAKRAAGKLRPVVLPTEPGAAGTSSKVPGQAARTPQVPQAKRKRASKVTPTDRQTKRPREMPAGAVQGRSPLLRGTATAPPEAGATGAYSSALRRELQVVFRSNRSDGSVLPEEVGMLRTHLITEMSQAMAGPSTGPPGPELRFRNSGRTECGWFLVTAETEESRDWLTQSCSPLVEGNLTFAPVLSSEAPWPTEIGFMLRCEAKPDQEKVEKMLGLQNRALGVSSWRHLSTEGEPGNWRLTYRVSGETRKRLEEAGWLMWYELVTIKAFRVTPHMRRPAPSASSQKPGTEKEKK